MSYISYIFLKENRIMFLKIILNDYPFFRLKPSNKNRDGSTILS